MRDLGLTRRQAAALLAAGAASCATPQMPAGQRARAADAMKRATRFMVERVAHQGGYVWSYLPDLSRRWGDMEAYATVQWVQPPGTATMGHVFLDAYRATQDRYYLSAAERVARALIAGQHPAGGWNYMIDTAGEASLRRWYDTIGRNGWRLEEFHHYYGNATFDDAGTAEASQFLIRLSRERESQTINAAAERAIRFVLDSQLESGGWPQRSPRGEAVSLHGQPDYTGYLTFNDDVAGENIKTLLMARQSGDRQDLRDAILRGMRSYPLAQRPAPQAGWALQYDAAMQPAAARTYEPRALATHTTENCIRQCLDFYVMTQDPRFLERIPEALAWLQSVRLPEDQIRNGRAYPTFIELGTDRALTVHRRGSNVVNGAYYADHNPASPITHYSQTRALNLAPLEGRLETLHGASRDELASLRRELIPDAPPLFFVEPAANSDLNNPIAPPVAVETLLSSLNEEGYWPTPLVAASNPYIGDGSATPAPGDYSQTRVGDASDTSPYIAASPVLGISTGAYIQNMAALIRFVAN